MAQARKIETEDFAEEFKDYLDNDSKEEEKEQAAVADSVAAYLRFLYKQNILSFDEEKLLATLARNGNEEARNKLIERNTRLVVSIAKCYRDNGVDFPDLIQEGNLGLFKGVKNFDPEMGFRFSTYATHWVRQAVTRAIESQGRTIRVPSYVIQRYKKLRKLLRDEPQLSIDELAKKTNLKVEDVIVALASSEDLESIDDRKCEKGRTLLEELETEISDPVEEAEKRELGEKLEELLSLLSQDERDMILMRHVDELTYQAIGKHFHVTRECIRQRLLRVMRKLKVGAIKLRIEDFLEEWLKDKG